MLEFAAIEVGTGGLPGCHRCRPHSATSHYPTPEVVERICEVAAAWDRGPGPNIMLRGAEPFAHPELPAIVAACVQAGAERIGLETSGGALSAHGNASGVLGAGVRHLRVWMPDTDESRGDALTGRTGATRDGIAGVRAFVAAAREAAVTVAITAVVPVCRHNLEFLPSIVAGAAACGFHALRLEGGADLPQTAGGMLAAACDTGMVNGLWVEADPALPLPADHRLHVVNGDLR